MLRKALRSIVLIAAGISAVALGSLLGAAPSQAIAPDWFAAASPQLSLVRQLPSDVAPPSNSTSCSWIAYLPKGILAPEADCVGKTSIGYLSGLGHGLMVDESTFVPLKPVAGNAIYHPMPNSSKIMMVNYSTGTRWENIGVYNNLQRSDLKDMRIFCGLSCTNRQLQISKLPDFYVSGSDGKALLLNIADITLSSNSEWMVVDSPSGLLRVNMQDGSQAAFPFAQSLAQLPYAGQSFIQMAVSDDGQFVAVAQTVRMDGVAPNLWLYDLGSCTGKPVNSAQTIAEGCHTRDLWNGWHGKDSHSSDTGLSKAFTKPSSIVNPSFVGSNNENLSFDITYNKNGKSFDAGTYILDTPITGV